MEPGQRLYMVFSRGRRLRFLSHLDMMRLWERALRRARLPLRYSQGYHPHPRLSLALPLAVGMTAAAEWLECELSLPVSPPEVQSRLISHLPSGIALRQVAEAPWKAPSLAARLRASSYYVQVRRSPPLEEVQGRIDRLSRAASWVVEEEHKGRMRTVDVRKMVDSIALDPRADGQHQVRVILRHRAEQSARVEAVLRALGLGPEFLAHRQELVFETLPPAEQDGAMCR
jgi:radical SAM-linked protein